MLRAKRKPLLIPVFVGALALASHAVGAGQSVAGAPLVRPFSSKITTPKQFLGFDVCADYQLANYQQLSAYWTKLAKESNRLKLTSIGKTEEGRDQWMLIISDPSNLRNLDSIKKMNRELALAKSISTVEAARSTAAKSKAVIWIDGGLHSNETISTQSLIEMAYQLAAAEDPETKRILKDTVILLVHANPDGMDLVSDWYMRRKDPKTRSLAGIPRLYQKYAGHDNNRDFYASNLAETRNLNRVLYQEWLPQVVYNHHQSAPAGTMMYIPPFRNPFNYHVDPLVQISTDLVGTLMHRRLISEGKQGSVMRNGASFSSWWNGGLRTTTYFHNMVGILTELWGSPNPTKIPFRVERQIPSADLPNPIDVEEWHARQSLEYEIVANYALLDYASRTKEELLVNVYKAARSSIDKGSRDHWTRYPARITALGEKALTDPALRDARAYVIPADQPDFPTAAKLVQRLQITGVDVEVLTQPSGKYPAGSFLVRLAQAFRPHILDMFEPQDHPNDLEYPGGPPIRPYDNAGYTLAYQMGVQFDRIIDEPKFVTAPLTTNPLRLVLPEKTNGGYLAKASQNDSFALANFALRNNVPVQRQANGDFLIGSSFPVEEAKKKLTSGELTAVDASPNANLTRRLRVGLWDVYGGSMDSGWLRLTLEKFGFDFTVLYGADLNSADLKDRFDVILFPDGAVFPRDAETPRENPLLTDPTVDAELKRRMEEVSVKVTMPNLKRFAEAGGRVVCIGGSGLNLAKHFGLPVTSALVKEKDGKTVPLANTEFYLPGSVLRVALNRNHPLTTGYTQDEIDLMFDLSPAFKLGAGANRVAWFNTGKPLRSGWAYGQEKLEGATAIADVPVGKGRVILFGPEVNFRAQPDGAFKLLFNALSDWP